MMIKFFTTGGTIDKIYFDQKNKYEVGAPYIKVLMKELKINFDYEIDSVFRKDSLDITDKDRKLLFSKIQSDPSQHIIVTHGTDTMIDTAKKLTAIKNKVIVLTGAIEPAKFKTSDAVFNIGCAVAAVQSLKKGVYIVMNGTIFKPDNVIKDLKKGQFFRLDKIN